MVILGGWVFFMSEASLYSVHGRADGCPKLGKRPHLWLEQAKGARPGRRRRGREGPPAGGLSCLVKTGKTTPDDVEAPPFPRLFGGTGRMAL